PLERRLEIVRRTQVGAHDLDGLRPAQILDAGGRTDERADRMPPGEQGGDDVASEESVCSGDQDVHEMARSSRGFRAATSLFTSRTCCAATGSLAPVVSAS